MKMAGEVTLLCRKKEAQLGPACFRRQSGHLGSERRYRPSGWPTARYQGPNLMSSHCSLLAIKDGEGEKEEIGTRTCALTVLFIGT